MSCELTPKSDRVVVALRERATSLPPPYPAAARSGSIRDSDSREVSANNTRSILDLSQWETANLSPRIASWPFDRLRVMSAFSTRQWRVLAKRSFHRLASPIICTLLRCRIRGSPWSYLNIKTRHKISFFIVAPVYTFCTKSAERNECRDGYVVGRRREREERAKSSPATSWRTRYWYYVCSLEPHYFVLSALEMR